VRPCSTSKTAELPSGVEIAAGDVLDRPSVERAARDCEGVFHCAGHVSRRSEDAETMRRIHVDGTKNVLDACIAQGVSKAVVASTSGTIAVSDNPEHIATERDEAPIGILQRWPYYRAKLFAERAALERNGAPLPNGASFAVTCVNPTLLLGPGDTGGSSTTDVRLFLERKIPFIPPGGISYVDARDAAEGMYLAMIRGVGGQRYLLGACNVTLAEFFARLERVSGVRAPVVPLLANKPASELARFGARALERLSERIGIPSPVDVVSLDMAHYYWYLDASVAESELGWVARDPLETLSDTVRDLRDRGVIWPDVSLPHVATNLLAKRMISTIPSHRGEPRS